jgi:DNA-binding helix-hairpin-helix protein with protein kinase domain
MDSISLSPATISIHGSSAKAYKKQFTLFNHARVSFQGVVTPQIPGIRVEPRIFPVDATTAFLNFTIFIDSKAYLSHKAKKPPVQLSEEIIVITTIGKKAINLKIEYTKESALQSALLFPSPPKAIPTERLATHHSQRFRSRRHGHTIRKRTVYLENGESLKLFSTGMSGGEGEIYFVNDHATSCAKLFHPHSITPELVEKIEYMVNNPLNSFLLSVVAWPTACLYDKSDSNRRFLGFLMPYIDPSSYEEAHKWYDPQDRKKQKKAPLTLEERLSVIYQLATAVQGLHSLGHAVGDLRETNILIGPKGIVIIDCDSFQVQKSNSPSFYPTRVATPEYLPFESQGKDFSKQSFSRIDSDRFALAVLIFKILMDGVHPYQSQGRLVSHAPSTADKIKRGYFAFDGKLAGLYPPPYAPDYQTHVPNTFARCFTKTFVQGHKEPKNRTRPEQFVTACTVAMPHLFPAPQPPISALPKTSSLPLKKKEDLKKTKDITPFPLPTPPVPVVSSKQPEFPKAPLRSPYYTNNGISIVPGQLLWKMPTGTVYEVGSGTVYHAVFSSAYHLNSLPSCPAYSRRLSSLFSHYPGLLQNNVLWPQTLIFHHQNEKEPIGYLIPAFDRTMWREWHECAASHTVFQTKLTAAKNLAWTLKHLHAKGYAAGHLSDRTILTNERGQVKLISADAIAGRTRKSLLQYAEFHPGRYRHASNDDTTFDPYYCDRFALAVLIFMMTMNGSHPFHAGNYKAEAEQDHKESNTPNSTQFPLVSSADILSYDSASSFQTISHQNSKYWHLPARLRVMFYRAFTNLQTITLPDPNEWCELLKDLETNALRCTVNETHWYDREQGYCPRCAESFQPIQALTAWFSCVCFPCKQYPKLLSPVDEKIQIWHMPAPKQYALVGHPILLLNATSHQPPYTSLIIYRPGFLITLDLVHLHHLLYLAEQVQCAWNDWYTLYYSNMQFTCDKDEVCAEYHFGGEQVIGWFDISDSLEEGDSEQDIIYEPITEDLFEPIESVESVEPIEPVEPIETEPMNMDTEEEDVDRDECKGEDVDEKHKDSNRFWNYFSSLIKHK